MAYSFDGIDDGYYSNNGVRPLTTFPLSISYWFKFLGVPSGAFSAAVGYTLNSPPASGTSYSRTSLGVLGEDGFYQLAIQDSTNTSTFFIYSYYFPYVGDPFGEDWQHIAAVMTSSQAKIFCNGQLTNTLAMTPGVTSPFGSRLAINLLREYFAGDGTNYFGPAGTAEVAMWNSALTDEQVESLAKGFSAKRVNPQGLRFYSPLIRNVTDTSQGIRINTAGSPTVIGHPRII